MDRAGHRREAANPEAASQARSFEAEPAREQDGLYLGATNTPGMDGARLLTGGDTGSGARRLLALQRLAGNKAVASVLQRNGGPPHGGGRLPLATVVRVTTGGQPAIEGATSVQPTGPSKMRVTAPDTNLPETTVEIPAPHQLGPGRQLKVGVVQTLMGSTRIARYRSPGATPTDPPIEKRMEMGQSRDAAVGADPNTGALKATDPPFFLPPVTLSDVNNHSTIKVKEGGQADLLDRPGWTVPVALDKGEFAPMLYETDGSDDFRTSIAAKYTDDKTLHHMNPVEWKVPWLVSPVDPFAGGKGGKGKVDTAKAPPPETEVDAAAIRAAAGEGKNYIAFPTLGDAMMCSVGTLLANLPGAADNDPQSFMHTMTALSYKNPTFTVTLKVDKKLRSIGKERIRVTADSGVVAAYPKTFEVDEGDSVSMSFRMLELLEPSSIVTRKAIRFHVTVEPLISGTATSVRSMPFPYLPVSETFEIETAQYHLTARASG